MSAGRRTIRDPAALNEREQEIIVAIAAAGGALPQAAEALGIALGTLKNRIAVIREKIGSAAYNAAVGKGA